VHISANVGFLNIKQQLLLLLLHCDHASIWHRYGDMAPQSTCKQTHGRTHRTTNLIISSNVHFVPLAEIMKYSSCE